MKAEVPLMRFDAPIAVFGGCYSNLEATVALVRHIRATWHTCKSPHLHGDVRRLRSGRRSLCRAGAQRCEHVVMGIAKKALRLPKRLRVVVFRKAVIANDCPPPGLRMLIDRYLLNHANWMATLPRRIDVQIGGARLTVVHGGMEEINQFMFASTSGQAKAPN